MGEKWLSKIAKTGNYNDLEVKPTAKDIGAADIDHTHNYASSTSAGGPSDSALKLEQERTISLSGDLTGSGKFDGSNDLNINAKITTNELSLGSNGIFKIGGSTFKSNYDSYGDILTISSGGTVTISSGEGLERFKTECPLNNEELSLASDSDVIIATNLQDGKKVKLYKVSKDGNNNEFSLRNIKISTSEPSGGENGDIWIQY